MSTISASTTSTTAFKITTDTTGALVFQTGASPTTAMTLGSDQSVTFAGTPTYSGGTANGVAYLNGSKVLTTGTALVFDGTNLGVGVTPSAWADYKALQMPGAAFLGYSDGSGNNQAIVAANCYWNGANWIYRTTDQAARYSLYDGQAIWYNAPSGTAGNAITFTQAMTLDANGKLLVGNTSSIGSPYIQSKTTNNTTVSGSYVWNSSDQGILLRNDSNTANTAIGLTMFGGSSGNSVGAVYMVQETANALGALAFYTGGSSAGSPYAYERARITSGGQLLVGTTTTSGGEVARFEAASTASIGIIGSTSGACYLNFGDTSDANVGFIGYDHTNNFMNFRTNGSERARITSSGNFLIGQTSSSHSTFQLEAANSGSSGAKIGIISLGRSGGDYPYVGYNFAMTGTSGSYIYAGSDYASSIYFYVGGIYTYTANSGTAGNSISYTAGPYVVRGGTSWTNSSDERLKDITGEIQNGLAKVCALSAATYTWKADEEKVPQIGLIAQNVLTVVPEAVVVPEEEFNGKSETAMGVNYDRLIPVLVAAIKELNAKVVALENK